MISKEVVINNQVGLHARPATFFIQKANEFKSSIWVEKEDRRVNAKSLLGVLSLGIVKGTVVTLIADGADEVDIVLNVGYFRDEAYEELCDEIAEIKQVVGDRPLKVILETGYLKTAEAIRRASILSMYSGCDFIKTSTGKIYPGASLEAAYVMCQCIKEYFVQHGRMVGFKASGGIRSTEDAVKYYTIVKEVLGEKWLNNQYFRIGASSLANSLFQSFTGSEEKPF